MFKDTKRVEKQDNISKLRAYENIIEWLYTHDGSYSDKLKWRNEFLEMLKWNFNKLN